MGALIAKNAVGGFWLYGPRLVELIRSPVIESFGFSYSSEGFDDYHDWVKVDKAAVANEKTRGATDRNEPAGRLRLLDTNAGIYRSIVPQVRAVAPQALVLVVTDPPDPLADVEFCAVLLPLYAHVSRPFGPVSL